VQEIWETYQDQGLMVLSIGVGMDQATCQQWISTYGLTHPVLSDPGGSIWALFEEMYVPLNAIIDGEMILQYTESGFDEPAVIATIEQLLAQLLRIDHVPLKDTEDDLNPYAVNCSITSNYSLITDQLQLHWNLDGGPTFTEVVLTPFGGDDYTSEIPAQPYGTTVYYYLSAADTGGNASTHPSGAPTELHSFHVGPDTTPPVIDHDPLSDQVLASWPATVTATVTDNQGVNTVTLEFTIDGGPVQSVPMLPTRDGVYSADFSGSVSIGDTVEYRIVAVDVASTPNTATDPTAGYYSFAIIDQIPVFIYDPDPTPLTGTFIGQFLDAQGISYDAGAGLPEHCSWYRTIFVCLGIFPNNHQLTAAEGQALAEFLDNGGRLYMEGGDTWAFDPATAVHPYFNIDGLADGTGDAGPIAGAAGTFTEGMYFQYQGENSWIDHLAPLGSAFAIFLETSPQYINGVAYDGGGYRTVGTSFELGGLVDAASPSTKDELLEEILEFFGMDASGLVFEDGFESGDTSTWSATVP
jgi:hypothetical protein